jgi:ribosomal protein S18 acetylase RimI-like enzyme
MSDLARAQRFEESLRERCAERIVPFAFGRALFSDTYPQVWDLNMLRVDRPAGATVAALVEEAERLHGGAGHRHRRIVILDEAAGAELAPGFELLGWRIDRFLFMAYRGSGTRRVETDTVEEIDAAALRQLREEIAAGEPWAESEEVVRMVLDAGELLAREGNVRHFAARVNGEIAAAADLYSDGRTAQVEDVSTRPTFRGRGLASAVVLRAVKEALAAGHDFVFLVADDEDWPKDLYARLGFAPLGRKVVFFRPPGETLAGGASPAARAP